MNSPVFVPSTSGRLVAVAGSGPAAILVMMVPLIAGLRAVHVAPASALVHSGSDPEGPFSPPAIRRTGGLTAATAIGSEHVVATETHGRRVPSAPLEKQKSLGTGLTVRRKDI